MLARVPLAIALDFDPGAVDQEMHRPGCGTARQDNGKIFLTAAERAEIGNRPVQPGQLQETCDEPRRLPQCHSEHHLERQTRLNGGIAIDLSTTALARWSSFPCHLGIEPDRQ